MELSSICGAQSVGLRTCLEGDQSVGLRTCLKRNQSVGLGLRGPGVESDQGSVGLKAEPE